MNECSGNTKKHPYSNDARAINFLIAESFSACAETEVVKSEKSYVRELEFLKLKFEACLKVKSQQSVTS